MFENYVYGTVVVTTQTLIDLQALILTEDVIYFNYSLDVSSAPKVQVDPNVGTDIQYIFNPALATWRLHILSSPQNSLTTHPTYIAGEDTLNLPGFVWTATALLPEDVYVFPE